MTQEKKNAGYEGEADQHKKLPKEILQCSYNEKWLYLY